jgi:hypothetical protein
MGPHHTGDDSRPTRLVGGPASSPGFPMKIFIEQDQVFPVRVRGVSEILTVAWPAALAIR